MTSHILTHNYYAITSLVMLTIGSFYICNQVHHRWLSQFKISLMDTNALIKLFIALLGFSIVSWRPLLEANYQIQLICLFIGIGIGFFFVDIETYILRHTPNKNFVKSPLSNTSQSLIKSILSRAKPAKINHDLPSYHSTMITGACEEILYRGFMTVLCMNFLNIYSSIFCLLLFTLFFALSHLSLGSAHVLSKFILGLICLLSYLYTKTIVTPIMIHMTFNIIAINKFWKMAYE